MKTKKLHLIIYLLIICKLLMAKPFKSDLVIHEHINEPTLRAYHVGFDQNMFRFEPLVDVLRSVIPEFALGYYCGENVPLTEIVEKLKLAAETVFLTEKYQRRGEFGELILHLLLRDFHNTTPLISKIYFKDAHDITVHGFDGVQITTDDGKNRLWLGESKLYKSGKDGVEELANDIAKHVNGDYLRKEFSLISRKIPTDIPNRNYWLQLMDKHQTLDNVFSSIVIPMVCTYSSPIFDDHTDNTAQYFDAFEKECRQLLVDFTNACKNPPPVEFILLLLPVPCKDQLNTALFNRLKAMQNI